MKNMCYEWYYQNLTALWGVLRISDLKGIMDETT
jgi:hypothetical protein